MNPEERQHLAEAVRAACFKAAKEGYEQASASGLCHEGAVEASLGAVSMVDIKAVLAALEQGKKPG
ncbi:MAG TPA: acetyltransferase [Gammaproteobacteria bacterium]|nr:acetyltransferase [Gammaproteobacteria bacterium]